MHFQAFAKGGHRDELREGDTGQREGSRYARATIDTCLRSTIVPRIQKHRIVHPSSHTAVHNTPYAEIYFRDETIKESGPGPSTRFHVFTDPREGKSTQDEARAANQ